MANHTQGPWEKDYGGTIGHIKSVAPHEYGMTPTVARYDMAAQSLTKEEIESNARLIAAAPEMLKALRDLVHAVACHKENCNWELGRAAEAISKAEGLTI